MPTCRAGYRHRRSAWRCSRGIWKRGSAPLLDAGAGTGLIGEWLGIIGYPHVEALDISEGMLAEAAKKRRLRSAALPCARRTVALR